jgi:DNA ligase-1
MTHLARLVDTSHRVAATAARLTKVRELAALLVTLELDEIEIAVLYLAGEARQGRIGIGYQTLTEAGVVPAAAMESLSLAEVDRCLDDLRAVRGSGSTARRSAALRGLFSRATRHEQHFLTRLLAGELRQGALAGVMTDAIAVAAAVPALEVRRASMYARNLGKVAEAALSGGSGSLAQFQLEMFSPLSPMLAQPASDVGEALLELHGLAAFEWKMDGARIQVHKRGAEVRIYTRGLNDVSAAVPELLELARTFEAHTLVLDGEAIVQDAAGYPSPFQVTMRRFGRKLDVESLRKALPISAFFFDCMRLEEQSVAERPTRERIEALGKAVPPRFLIPRLVTTSASEAASFYAAAIAAGHEGLMAKSLDAPYEAGNRGASWLKIKRAHTLDLVVLAAEWGHGRRTGKLSNLHLGALDPGTGKYVMLGKTFKGLTDAMLEWQTRELLARETHRDHAAVYVRPDLVVEVAFSDLQASKRYRGGLALRLARVKRYRDDKHAADADTMDDVRSIARAAAGPDA